MVPDPDPSEFDAIAAAKELDDMLAESSTAHDAELEELANQLAAANLRADQAHAEIEAAGKRLASASARELERRTREILESFLPVVDDLDRAVVAAKQVAESADVVAGLELVKRSMLARFAQFGVTHVPALGEPFDPQRHDAIAAVPVTDPAKDGRVIDVVREGYLIGEETLRPAGVAVGKLAR